jgi:hypothetical protein
MLNSFATVGIDELPSSEELEEEEDGFDVADLCRGLQAETRDEFMPPGRRRDSTQTDITLGQRLYIAQAEWSLTGRQRDVLTYVAEGSTNEEVALTRVSPF